jgi:hypothetical protein
MAAKASHVTKRCCAERFNTLTNPDAQSLEQAPEMMTANGKNVMRHFASGCGVPMMEGVSIR